MAVEVTSLSLNVKSDSVSRGSDRLNRLTTSATRAEGATNKFNRATSSGAKAAAGAATATKGMTTATYGLGTALKSALAPLLALIGPVLLLKKAFTSTVELQDFQAQLKTATGSVENAAIAFEALEDFASETPYALEQSLEAFIKLTNLGLEPSERALKSYGNTASAMGKDLTQLIEAVADAATGEFERLKEFGIKAKSEGDKVSFTFRGVTTTVGKNAKEIEGYLMALGENEFSTAMSDRMATVGGLVSNLGDQWNKLFRVISEMGVGNVIAKGLQFGIDVLTEFIAILESGQFEAELDSWGAAFDGWARDFEDTLKIIGELFGVASQDWVDTSGGGFKEILELFKLLPAQIRAWVQRIGVEISAIAMWGEAAAKGVWEVFVAYFQGLVDTTKNYAKLIGKALNPFSDTDIKTALKQAWKEQEKIALATADKITVAYVEAEKNITAVSQARRDMIKEIEVDFNATVAQVDNLSQKSRQLRAEYDKEREARRKARLEGTAPDTLAQFKITPKGGATATSPPPKVDTATKRALDALVKDLSKEREVYDTHYAELEGKRRDQYDKDQDLLEKALDKKLLSEQQFAELSKENWQRYMLDIQQLETQQLEERNQRQITATSNLFQALSQLEQGKNESSQRRKKAFAIAAATINTYQGASQALNEQGVSTYAKIANAATVIATGLAQVQSIREAGNYATGGIVPGASYSGDQLTANVNSGEMILNRSQQARLFALADNGTTTSGNAGNVALNVTVENYGSSKITVERMSETDVRIIARDVVREDAPAVIAADLGNPNSRTSSALARNTNAQRRRN